MEMDLGSGRGKKTSARWFLRAGLTRGRVAPHDFGGSLGMEDQQMTDTRKGACLCGAVTFDADIAAPHYHACHCATCRRWGGPGMAAPVSDLRIAEGAPVKLFSSSDYGERGFCAECGSHLFWKMKDDSMIAVWVGALDNADGLLFDTQIFIDSKPAHYAFANETTDMTADEVFAASGAELFAAESGEG